MDAKEYLHEIMGHYTHKNLVVPDFEFKNEISKFMSMKSSDYADYEASVQRTQSLNFRWGHNHDFGMFKLDGDMRDRHIEIMARFIEEYDLPRNLDGEIVLDVGVWCGGTSLLLSGMGAKVDAIEEVEMYADCLRYLRTAFGINNMGVFGASLYDFYNENLKYDRIIFSGVLYHLSDPILALRMLFNMLKDGGTMYIETMTTPFFPEEPIIEYYGSSRQGWNWFAPNKNALGRMLGDVGFVRPYTPTIKNNRLTTAVQRMRWVPMVKAGLSREIK